MKATFIKGGLLKGNANLYKMEPPHEGHEYVVVSAISSAFDTCQPETYIFPANESGHVVDWGEMAGSGRGFNDHEVALRRAGYEVAVQGQKHRTELSEAAAQFMFDGD